MLLTGAVEAQTLRVGLSAAITSMDPHFHLATPNMAAAASNQNGPSTAPS
jgi:hypothetical protein